MIITYTRQMPLTPNLFSDLLQWLQGRNEVRWRPGQEASLAPPCSNLQVLRKQICCWRKYLRHCCDFEESTCDIVATKLRPLSPLITPLNSC